MGKSIILRASILYFVLLLANITVMILMVFENQVDLIAQNTQVNSRLIGLRFREAFSDTDIHEPDSALLDSFNVTSYRVYTGSGRLVSASVGNADTDLDRTAGIHTALTRRDFENRLFHHVVDHQGRTLELYIPVSNAEMNDHVVVATVALDGVDRQIGYLYRQATILGLLVLALHLLYAWYLAHTVLRPMRRIMAATEHVTRGNLDVRINLPQRNELGRMATAFNEMSVAIVRMQNEARSSNPLTTLPGNPAIAEMLSSRLTVPTAVLYIDLDNFKAFNDHYGFTRGDEALIFARDCIVTEAQSTPDTFVGHQGGDDFIVITGTESWEVIAQGIVDRFERDKAVLFDQADLRRGYTVGRDRSGTEQRFPLLTVSIAVVTNEERTFSHPGQLAEVAAEVKEQAKQSEGSTWMVDRRGDTATKKTGRAVGS